MVSYICDPVQNDPSSEAVDSRLHWDVSFERLLQLHNYLAWTRIIRKRNQLHNERTNNLVERTNKRRKTTKRRQKYKDGQEQTWTIEEGHCWMLDAGCWMLDAGCWTVGDGCWTLDDRGQTTIVLRTSTKRLRPRLRLRLRQTGRQT